MALEPCPECGHEISDKATLCPNCGVKIDRTTKTQRGCMMLGCAPYIVVILVIIGAMFGGLTGGILGGILGLLFAIGYWIYGDKNAAKPESK